MTEQQFGKLLFFLFIIIITICGFATACDIRANNLQVQMSNRDYCYERQETAEIDTWRPCRSK